MQICALLSYYDEPWLKQHVKSLRLAGVSKLVAVDGAYALFPGGKARSPVSNHRDLERACEKTGIELVHHVPDDVWGGNEVEKRTFLFELAERHTTPDDWYFVADGDEFVTAAPDDLPGLLADTLEPVGECELYEGREANTLRMFFRAQRGIRPTGLHFTYATPDGTVLWGGYAAETASAARLPVRVRHRTLQRPTARRAASLAYYEARDEQDIEQGPCAWCGEPTAATIPYQWRPAKGGIVAQRASVCPDCRPRREAESVEQAAALGFDARPHLPVLSQ